MTDGVADVTQDAASNVDHVGCVFVSCLCVADVMETAYLFLIWAKTPDFCPRITFGVSLIICMMFDHGISSSSRHTLMAATMFSAFLY